MANEIIKKTLDISLFPKEHIVYNILNSGSEVVKNYVDKIYNDQPTLQERITKFLSDNGTVPTDEKLTSWFKEFNHELDLVKLLSQATLTDLNTNLFKINEADSDIIKDLKTIALSTETDFNSQDLLKTCFEDYEGGICWVLFVVNTFKNFYLDIIPKFIQGKLDETKIAVKDLDPQEWKHARFKLFCHLFDTFASVENETDLNDLREKSDKDLNAIEDLINKKKPDLNEVWKTNFTNRGVEGEYLKNKELSAEAIVEVANSLKAYDDVFSYMYNNFEPQKVNKWWKEVRPFWRENFTNKWGNPVIGVEVKSLTNLKNYIESKEKEIDNWISTFPIADYPNGVTSVKELVDKLKSNQTQPSGGTNEELNKWLKEFPVLDYPKGAEDVKAELKDFQGYVEGIVKNFQQQQNYIPEEVKSDEK